MAALLGSDPGVTVGAAVVAGLLTGGLPGRTEVLLCGLLVLVAAAHTELSVNAERLRRRIAATRYINMTSVWTFAAALLLPPGLATVVVVVILVREKLAGKDDIADPSLQALNTIKGGKNDRRT